MAGRRPLRRRRQRPSQRNALKYLAFPQVFQPIVSSGHRAKIREAYKALLPGPPDDVDRDLMTIRDKLQAQSPDKPVDFYVAPWVAAWKTGSTAAGRHAWLVHLPTGAPAGVVDRWLEDGFVALTAAKLRTLPPGSSLPAVRDAVSADYSAVEYVKQAELATAFHAFLSSMESGDVVVTVVGDAVHLGVLDEAAPWFAEAERAGRLRRRVRWHTSGAPVAVRDLPAPLPTRLATQGVVVDLSGDLDLLLALLDEDEELDPPPGPAPVLVQEGPPLPPATDELAKRLHVDRAQLQEWIDLLTDRQQVIFYGPPGTGKTYLAERLARFLADAGELESERVALVQFHPSTSPPARSAGSPPKPVTTRAVRTSCSSTRSTGRTWRRSSASCTTSWSTATAASGCCTGRTRRTRCRATCSSSAR